jgi:hypothetical protein
LFFWSFCYILLLFPPKYAVPLSPFFGLMDLTLFSTLQNDFSKLTPTISIFYNYFCGNLKPNYFKTPSWNLFAKSFTNCGSWLNYGVFAAYPKRLSFEK